MHILAHGISGLPWIAAFDWQGLADQARSLEPTLCPHHRTGRIARHHLHEVSMQRLFKLAARKAATSHCHGIATRLLENHYDLRTVQNCPVTPTSLPP
ncbi:MAG: hypothetical protein NTW21_20335 [Verrucomicrobia bacterium]|nr:hypothetical protein [Verrucomicrobiota bacterium]